MILVLEWVMEEKLSTFVRSEHEVGIIVIVSLWFTQKIN
jgi:hypothetical protein